MKSSKNTDAKLLSIYSERARHGSIVVQVRKCDVEICSDGGTVVHLWIPGTLLANEFIMN
jgi:hypothetical protein